MYGKGALTLIKDLAEFEMICSKKNKISRNYSIFSSIYFLLISCKIFAVMLDVIFISIDFIRIFQIIEFTKLNFHSKLRLRQVQPLRFQCWKFCKGKRSQKSTKKNDFKKFVIAISRLLVDTHPSDPWRSVIQLAL